ncbi:MAG: hypothetical protein ACRC3H_23555 [Lachnospiraceae bacterium]
MKLVIELDECENYGLSPALVYKRLREECVKTLSKKYGTDFWYMDTACDRTARELYSNIKNRRSAVKSLILTYNDAESCFKLFEQFANVWAENKRVTTY